MSFFLSSLLLINFSVTSSLPCRKVVHSPTQGAMAHLLFTALSQSSRLHLDSFFSFCLTFSISVSSPKYTQILPPFFQNKAQSPTLPFTITSSVSHRLPFHGPGRGAAVTWQPCIPMSPHPLPAPPAFLLHGRPWPDSASLAFELPPVLHFSAARVTCHPPLSNVALGATFTSLLWLEDKDHISCYLTSVMHTASTPRVLGKVVI